MLFGFCSYLISVEGCALWVVPYVFFVSKFNVSVVQLSCFRGRVCNLSGTCVFYVSKIQYFGFAVILFSWKVCTLHFWYLLLVQLSRDLCSNFRVRVARHVDTICFPCRCRRSKVAELLRGFEMSQNSELQYCAVACVTPLLNHVRSGVDRLGKIDLSPAIYGLLTG